MNHQFQAFRHTCSELVNCITNGRSSSIPPPAAEVGRAAPPAPEWVELADAVDAIILEYEQCVTE